MLLEWLARKHIEWVSYAQAPSHACFHSNMRLTLTAVLRSGSST